MATIIVVVLLAWAVLATFFLLLRNPLPLPDRGHRCFAVKDIQAQRIVASILKQFGLPERFTFTAGPTHQTLLWDNTTVIIRHEGDVRAEGLEPNAISVVVPDPLSAAKFAARALFVAGFKSEVKEGILPEIADKFVLVTSDAFDGWVLAFRRHILAMGPPLNKRKILP